jgi:hypothetical protein
MPGSPTPTKTPRITRRIEASASAECLYVYDRADSYWKTVTGLKSLYV